MPFWGKQKKSLNIISSTIIIDVRSMNNDDALNFENALFLPEKNKTYLASCLPFWLSCEGRITSFNREKVSQE